MAVHLSIQAARQLVATTWPYFASAVFRLVPREVNHPDLPTLAVDVHWRLYYNRDWVEAQPIGRLALAIAGHELRHLLNRHFHRAEGIERPGWVINYCQDYAINSEVKAFAEAGVNFRTGRNAAKVKIEADDAWLYPDTAPAEFGGPFEVNQLFEEYLRLFQDPPASPGGCGIGAGDCGSGASGAPRAYEAPAPGSSPDAPDGVSEAESRVIARGTAEAIKAHAVRYPGNLPGGLEVWAAYILTPAKVPWQQMLKATIRKILRWQAGQVERTYSRRSTRQPCRTRRQAVGRRFILPGLQAPKPKFAVVLDTSGSMTNDDYQAALSEIAMLARLEGGRGVPVLCCDAGASEVRLFKDCSRVRLEGGGGTDMGVGIARLAELDYPLAVVVTDGFTPWPADAPEGMAVVVCLTQPPEGTYTPPAWADVVHCYD